MEPHVLAQGVAQTDGDAAFDLTFETQAVDDTADILRQRDFVHLDLAGQGVDGDLGNMHGVRIGGRVVGDVLGTLGLALGFVIVRHHHQFGHGLKMHLPQQTIELDERRAVVRAHDRAATQVQLIGWFTQHRLGGAQDLRFRL